MLDVGFRILSTALPLSTPSTVHLPLLPRTASISPAVVIYYECPVLRTSESWLLEVS
jgi:hypothetical protein